MTDSQDIETATTAIQASTSNQPDNKTRRYDRQLRLWAASGQSALESARVLLLSGSATSTSILKNLVLPGIGHFTILDSQLVTPEDAGNNFFLEGPDTVGKSRAEEAVTLLRELNESVDGRADTRSIDEVLAVNKDYIASFSIVICHNLPPVLLDQLSAFLWSDSSLPPLIVVRSAGFLAEFFIQIHEHTIIDSHPDTPPSLRIDKPFPDLLDHSLKLDFGALDVTDHGHIPYVVILVRIMAEWKAKHDGMPPKTSAEKAEFKKIITSWKKKSDEENFDEAVAQAYRVWTETTVPSGIAALFRDPTLDNLTASSSPFFHLLAALRDFTLREPYTLPLNATLPDIKSDTANYVHLQTLYKRRAEEEKGIFRDILSERLLRIGAGEKEAAVVDGLVDSFVKNAHGLRVIRGDRWGALDQDKDTLVTALSIAPRDVGTHLALSALSHYLADRPNDQLTATNITSHIKSLLPEGTELPEELEQAVGEVIRAPTAELPNLAAFLGGLVAQEVIKVITKQYVPVKGICVVDLISSTTGVIGA